MARKVRTIGKIYSSLDGDFKPFLHSSRPRSFFRILDIEDSDMLMPLMDILLSFFVVEEHVFIFGKYKLGITLEDILFLTGLPIYGRPVISTFEKSRDLDAFSRVLGLETEKGKGVSTSVLISYIQDRKKDNTKRTIALILVLLIHCFITPSTNRQRVPTTYVQFLENLENVDGYAWGAALLSFLHCEIEKKENGGKAKYGNLWVVLSFFLICIPKLRDAIGIELNLEDGEVPLISMIVSKVKPISHDHKKNYKNVRVILDNLSDTDICWMPYNDLILPSPLRTQLRYRALLSSLFCNNFVVYHRPHLVAEQFGESGDQDLTPMGWKYKRVIVKENRGPEKRNYEVFYAKELAIWRDAQLAILPEPIVNPARESSSTVHQDSPELALTIFTPDRANTPPSPVRPPIISPPPEDTPPQDIPQQIPSPGFPTVSPPRQQQQTRTFRNPSLCILTRPPRVIKPTQFWSPSGAKPRKRKK
ncbi:hypothetical protein CASFOL_022576 [Castilleja foliolosa]|uniref:Aminotransferase-like plant mobile domain-containing protein n=1 Tax=Castilleja foliolosa TaxID=1961234 RepID=A0ABD3CXL1_9LAMI